MNKAVSLTNLSYSVAGLDILKALTIEIPTHSYFAIAGVNGAGKSTLIKLILDLTGLNCLSMKKSGPIYNLKTCRI